MSGRQIQKGASPSSYNWAFFRNLIVRVAAWVDASLQASEPKGFSQDDLMAGIERGRIAAGERALEELEKIAVSGGLGFLEELPNGEYVVFTQGRIQWSSSVLADTFLPLNNLTTHE